MPTEFVGVRLPAELVTTVDQLASEQGVSRTAVIVSAIKAGLGLPSGATVEQRLTSVEQRLTNVEESVKQDKTGVKQNVKQRKTDVKQNVEQRKTPVKQTASGTTGLTIGLALLQAGAEITEAQATGGNRDRRMQTRYGLTAREWLQHQGWQMRGKRWYPPA